MKKKIIIPSLLLFAVTCFQSCKKEPSLSGGSSFSLDKFEQNIKNTYPSGVVGYSYAISYLNKVERFGAWGDARIATDGLKAYTVETRQELFSVTKFVTATTVCKVLGDLGKTLNEKAVNYLPANWKVHASYNDLTFEQLLSHKAWRLHQALTQMMCLLREAVV